MERCLSTVWVLEGEFGEGLTKYRTDGLQGVPEQRNGGCGGASQRGNSHHPVTHQRKSLSCNQKATCLQTGEKRRMCLVRPTKDATVVSDVTPSCRSRAGVYTIGVDL